MITTKVFFNNLIENVPELLPLYREHLSDYDEFLPHVFMADVARFVIGIACKIKNKSKKSEQKLSLILESFEDALKLGDEEIKNVIVVSFLENLEQDDPNYSFLKNQFGNELASNLETIEDYYS